MYLGNAAIDALAATLEVDDPEASSHWIEMHKGFAYGPDGFSGLIGFGDHSAPKTVLHRIGHSLLQTPFRYIGAQFPCFAVDYENVKSVAKRQNRQLNVDMVRQAITLSMLRQKLQLETVTQPILIIGDGFATMASLILLGVPNVTVVLVNLTKTLFVDLVYLQRTVPDCVFALARSSEEYEVALAEPAIKAIAVQARDANALKSSLIGICLNILSMQEMNPPAIASYFRIMRETPGPGTIFYCCNRLDKTLPDGTRVRFQEYPWCSQDEILLDGLCPWSQFYYSIRPPFYRKYDGRIWHRLAILAKTG